MAISTKCSNTRYRVRYCKVFSTSDTSFSFLCIHAGRVLRFDLLRRYHPCSYIGDVCGPLVQRLGMDEIFVDVTALISSDSSDSSRSSGSGGADITGHLYAPGSGGTLLEAQTGLEISLNVDSDAGAHRCEGSIPGSPELSSVAQLTAQGGGHDISQESAEGSEGGTAMRDSPIATNGTSGSNVGIRQACTGRGNGDPPNGEGGGVRRGLGARSGAVGVGDCRCGCRERLAATSAFADRVRKGLLEVVSLCFCIRR